MNAHRINAIPVAEPIWHGWALALGFVASVILLIALAQQNDARAKAQASLYAKCPRTQAVAAFLAEGP